jgi:hypothetical protein
VIIAVDFDGTLCMNDWPAIGAPRKGVIAYLRQRKQSGDKLILWTNRRGERLSEAISWCYEQGLEFDAVNENLPEIVERFGGDCRKVYADIYLDDKAMKPDEAERQGRFRRTVRRGS